MSLRPALFPAPRRLRLGAAALAGALLLSACTATAHGPAWPEPSPLPAPATPPLWPQPRPTPEPPQPPVLQTLPNFQAPSAPHCMRPVRLREVPGDAQAAYAGRPGEAHAGWPRHPLPSPRRDSARAESADKAVAAATAPAEALAGRAAAENRAPAAPAATFAEPARAQAWPDAAGQPLPSPRQPALAAQVTAGVVDDNADFSEYLAFRDRTQVPHRPREVRERYLLEVKDRRGRGIADAEVAVQAASGAAMWARTDASGRAWLHPDAFDPTGAPRYGVTVRKDGRSVRAQLQRGQKSSVEVVLDARPAPARARLDLLFLVDATGSMGDEIDKLKATLTSITAQLRDLPSQPDLCLGLVAYRDRGDQFLLRSHDFTHDVGDFLRNALGPLRAGGGGDYPEAMNEALHEAVHQMGWRGDGATRLVVLLADAPPQLGYGGPQYDEDMMAALGKGIKVFAVGASGLDRQGEYIQRQIAQYTGGRFVFLTYADAQRPSSGPGRDTTHDVRNYSVQTLDRLIVRLVSEELGKLATGG